MQARLREQLMGMCQCRPRRLLLGVGAAGARRVHAAPVAVVLVGAVGARQVGSSEWSVVAVDERYFSSTSDRV